MDSDTLIAGMADAARQAGAFIREQRRHFSSGAVVYKSHNQLVSYVDENAEKMLVTALHGLLPEAGFLTEEKTTEQTEAALCWIIDPLDGTTNFVHDVPVYSVSVALARGNEILAGVVYEVNRDELFTAAKGKGAFMNGIPLRVKTESALEATLMATGFPYYDFDGMDAYLQVLRQLMRQTHGLRRMGSAAVDLAYVACGRFDGFFELSLHAWDVAAGILLVQEAGGKVTDFKGGDDFLFGKSIIASSSAIYPQLRGVISEAFQP